MRITSADSMTSKPSEDEVSVNEFVAPDTEGTASVFAAEVGVACNKVASSGTAIQRKNCSLLYVPPHEESHFKRSYDLAGGIDGKMSAIKVKQSARCAKCSGGINCAPV